MTISRFINKFILISLIFSATQPAFAMDEPTNLSLSNRLKNFITSPKTVTFFGLVALGSFGYKTGNWEATAGLMGTTFVLYKVFDYHRNMAWRAELKTLIPQKTDKPQQCNLYDITKATELLCKINDKKLNDEMSYWTYPALKTNLQVMIKKNDENLYTVIPFKEKINNLLEVINHNSLKNHVNELFACINDYNSASNKQTKIILDEKIEEKYIAIKVLLI